MIARTALLLLLLAPPGAAAAADDSAAPGEADRRAIRGVIAAQLDAFRRDDAEAAFALAAPGIQVKFGNAATFLAMVRAAYRPVYRPAEVSFRALDLSGRTPVQEVLVVDSDGAAHLAFYPMRRADGAWRIAGCVLVPWEGGRAGLRPAARRRAAA